MTAAATCPNCGDALAGPMLDRRGDAEGYCARCQKMYPWPSAPGDDGDGSTPQEERPGAAPASEDEPKARPSQAQRLLRLVEASPAVLFTDQFGEPQAAIHGDGREVLRLGSKTFKWWLVRLLYDSEGKPPNADALRDALGVMAARARFDGPTHILHVRVAEHGGIYWYDLGDGPAVRIDANGWQVVERPPILFRRLSHQRPQATPERGGRLDNLLPFVNLRSDADRLLFLTALVAAFAPGFPHPVQASHGSQGSAKTSLSRIMKELVDPSAVHTLTAPDNLREFVQLAAHHWLLPLDNLSSLPDWLSDALSRACSGDGFSKRELYTDDDDVIYSFQRIIIVNGINLTIGKPDLLDRSIIIGMEAIGDRERREEEELWAAFTEAKPRILGAVFDILAAALREYPSVKLTARPRMADFARWGCAIARALGLNDSDFLAAYAKNVARQHEEAIAACPVAQTIVAFSADWQEWQGTPSELLGELEAVAQALHISIRAKSWPKSPAWLSKRIRQVQMNLSAQGITAEWGWQREGTDKRRIVAFRKVAENTVDTVPTVDRRDSVSKTEAIGGTVMGDDSVDRGHTVPDSVPEKQPLSDTEMGGGTLSTVGTIESPHLGDGAPACPHRPPGEAEDRWAHGDGGPDPHVCACCSGPVRPDLWVDGLCPACRDGRPVKEGSEHLVRLAFDLGARVVEKSG